MQKYSKLDQYFFMCKALKQSNFLVKSKRWMNIFLHTELSSFCPGILENWTFVELSIIFSYFNSIGFRNGQIFNFDLKKFSAILQKPICQNQWNLVQMLYYTFPNLISNFAKASNFYVFCKMKRRKFFQILWILF